VRGSVGDVGSLGDVGSVESVGSLYQLKKRMLRIVIGRKRFYRKYLFEKKDNFRLKNGFEAIPIGLLYEGFALGPYDS